MINLVPDFTFFYMLGIFLVVLIALDWLVFQPTLKIIDARLAQTDRLKETVATLNSETSKLLAEYEQHIISIRAKGSKERERILVDAHDREQKVIEAARTEAEKSLEGMRNDINLEMKEASLQMRQYVQGLSKDIIARLLERKAAA